MEYDNPTANNVTSRDKVWNPKNRSFDAITSIEKNRAAKTVTIVTENETIPLERTDKITVLRPWGDEKVALEQMTR